MPMRKQPMSVEIYEFTGRMLSALLMETASFVSILEKDYPYPEMELKVEGNDGDGYLITLYRLYDDTRKEII